MKRLKAAEESGIRKLITDTHGKDAEGGSIRLLTDGVEVGEKGRLMIENAKRRTKAERKANGQSSTPKVTAPTDGLLAQPTASPRSPAPIVTSASSAPCSPKGKGREVVLYPNTADATSSAALTLAHHSPQHPPTDLPLPPDSHLALALVQAGLPPTAINREAAAERAKLVGDVLKEKEDERSRLVPGWHFKVRNLSCGWSLPRTYSSHYVA